MRKKTEIFDLNIVIFLSVCVKSSKKGNFFWNTFQSSNQLWVQYMIDVYKYDW